MKALPWLIAIANAHDPVEGPIEFSQAEWLHIRNAIYDLAAYENALERIRDECFSGNAYDIAVSVIGKHPDDDRSQT